MYKNQELIKTNRKEKYKIAKELGFDTQTSRCIRDFRTRNFIKFCYNKINNESVNNE